jgi:ABC-type multidrug transport system ATPase subunit
MRIKLSQAGKRFNREWIFRKADLELVSGNAYAITGPNGSGKSTLLQSIGGMLQLSEGSISFESTKATLDSENYFTQLTYCAPYLDIIEEMTFREFLDFHTRFKPLLNGFTIDQVVEAVDLGHASGKQIRNYSSGMKQRVKLAQAIFSSAEIILLDEPCSNLDRKGIELYHSLISRYCLDRLVIVCSNDEVEYSFCKEVFSILDFKYN